MATRVQVVMTAEEREQFRRQAEREGASLSRWIREAALERLDAAQEQQRRAGPETLRALFAQCDAREAGNEPDWEEHAATIRRSRARGAAET